MPKYFNTIQLDFNAPWFKLLFQFVYCAIWSGRLALWSRVFMGITVNSGKSHCVVVTVTLFMNGGIWRATWLGHVTTTSPDILGLWLAQSLISITPDASFVCKSPHHAVSFTEYVSSSNINKNTDTRHNPNAVARRNIFLSLLTEILPNSPTEADFEEVYKVGLWPLSRYSKQKNVVVVHGVILCKWGHWCVSRVFRDLMWCCRLLWSSVINLQQAQENFNI